ncbi:hotdog domain-containing protein [Pseudonocardia sp. NPDC049154]|uniref:hotdog domain-containing protein n=1 Tax=Pseudonocardia sp. NPDC049154 TaxID=3155501 RepID=UPI00340C0DA9
METEWLQRLNPSARVYAVNSPSVSVPPIVQLANRAAADGRPFAPAHARFGVLFCEVRPGRCVARMPVAPATAADGALDPAGVLVLTDAALGVAIGSGLPDGRRITTLSLGLSTTGRRPAGPSLTATAQVIGDPGHGLGTGVLTDETGTELARLRTRCAVIDGAPPAGEPSLIVGVPPASGAGSAWQASVEDETDRFVVLRASAPPGLGNNTRRVQGGAVAAFVELAVARALRRVPAWPSRPTDGPVVRDLDVTYLRGVPADGAPLRCRAVVQHSGRQFATARAELFDGAGRLLAAGTASRYLAG